MKYSHKLLAAVATIGVLPATAIAQAAPDQTAQDTIDDSQSTDTEIVVTGKFLDQGSKSAMKMDVAVLDTPYSVSSYSEEFVKSLETTNISDLYNYMTGVKKSGVTAYDITLRGFKSSGDDRNALMVDGLPGLTGRYASPPTIGIERVELVKGPMSVLYGQIQPGGFINMITKKPESRAKTTIEFRGNTFASPSRAFGDHNSISGAFDSTGGLMDDGALAYRVVGQLTRNKGFRVDAYHDQEFIAPSLAWEVGPSTKLTIQGEYRRTKEHFDVGLAAPFDGATSATSTIYDINAVAPIETAYTQPDNYRVEKGTTISAFLNQEIGNSWKINAGYRHVRYNSDQQDISSTGVNRYNGELRVTRRARQLQTHREYDYGDLNLTGSFDTGSIEHKLLIGINAGIDFVRENRLKFFNGGNRNTTTGVCPAGQICLDVALYNPDLTAFPAFDSMPAGAASGLTDRQITSRNYGIYLSDLVTLTDWLKVSLAARKFSETSKTYADRRNDPNGLKIKTTKKDFLPSAGVMIQPSNNITFYGSYAESFVPVDPGLFDVNGQNNFTPITGKQIEFGVKTERLLDGKLNFTAAVYQIDNTGQTTQTICPLGSCTVQLGKSRAKGFESEANFSPLDNWQVILGYTYIDAKVLTTGPGLEFQEGRRLPNVARHAANLWTRYDWENGFGVGLGVTYTGQREGVLPTQLSDLKRLDLPAYTVVDMGFYYSRDRYSINLKVGNVLNKTYFQNSGGGSQGRVQIQPGDPRYLTLTARYNF
ncbi:iron complex outermembrane receptor protein [Novosphingobium kunmingense]|uniref:Iron complex outermembrane receptor protein n=1 Tax=Novosphingobium kunmingense TaxID=1211806 RepID=A0A2N0HJA5_9SPHN|nr:TonB-dependent receptor [Novosphingobium kunmingense]PKB19024.1 iron complex outermembrane receptor protein [Novosphingobium kunmingense]